MAIFLVNYKDTCSPLAATILMLAIGNCLLDEECAPKADKAIDTLSV